MKKVLSHAHLQSLEQRDKSTHDQNKQILNNISCKTVYYYLENRGLIFSKFFHGKKPLWELKLVKMKQKASIFIVNK